MAMATVAVKPEIIRWALERSGRSKQMLAPKFPKLELWEKGEAYPTLRQLEELSRKTYTPLGYFFLSEPPEEKLPVPVFRTLWDKSLIHPSPDLLETVQTMQRRQDWMREYLLDRGQLPLPFISSANTNNSVTEVADKIREVLGLEPDWARHERKWEDALRTLRNAIDDAGILIVANGIVGNNTHRKLDVDEFRGFVLCDEYAPLIFVNSADVKAAQMFTIAHELAHLWLGQGGVFDLHNMQPADSKIEIFCNKIAAEFLVPEEIFLKQWPKAQSNQEPYQSLARYFKVSPLVTARRALDLHLIDKQTFFDFYDAYISEAKYKTAKQKGGGDFYTNQDMRIGKRFAVTIIRAAKEGRLLYRDAYQLTGLNGATFDRYAKSLGGTN